MNIHISNLSVHVFAADLMKLFTAYGEVVRALVFRSEKSGQSLGFALIEMPDNAQASQAILCLHNTSLDGRPMMLCERRPEECHN
jgi:RNA recognition motif-containing protein